MLLVAVGLLGYVLLALEFVRRPPPRTRPVLNVLLAAGAVFAVVGVMIQLRPASSAVRAGQSAPSAPVAATPSVAPVVPPPQPTLPAAGDPAAASTLAPAADAPAWPGQAAAASTTPRATDASTPPALPGITLAATRRTLEGDPFGLQFTEGDRAAGFTSRCGRRRDARTGADLMVCLYSAGSTDVAWLEASVVGVNTAAASRLFPYVASLPFDGNEQTASHAWAAEGWSLATTPGSILKRDVGGVTMELYGTGGTTVFLDLVPSDLHAWMAAHP